MSAIDTSRVLPERYYHTHFLQLKTELSVLFGHWLSETEKRFFDDLVTLPLDAQCLYLRLVNRKGPYFCAPNVFYTDIGCCETAGRYLQRAGYLTDVRNVSDLTDITDSTLYEPILNIWDITLLKAAARAFLMEAPNACKSKKKLITTLSASPYAADVINYCITYYGPVWQINHQSTWHWLLFLYFGYPETNLSRFAVHDLKWTPPDTVAPDKLTPRFDNRHHAEETYQWHVLYDQFRLLREDKTVSSGDASLNLYDWLHSCLDRVEFPAASADAQAIGERLIGKIAYRLEQAKAFEKALTLYDKLNTTDAIIRRLKLLWKTGKKEQALQLARERMSQPNDIEEQLYVEKFLTRANRSKKPACLLSALPVQARVLNRRSDTTIERDVLTQLAAEGWYGVHSENWIWRSLFGLTFWEELHQPLEGLYHNGLQALPSDLSDHRRFWRNRGHLFENRLNQLATPQQWWQHIQSVIQAHAGKTDAFVHWSDTAYRVVSVWLKRLPLDSLKRILLLMAQDIERLKSGLPDLFVWKEEDTAELSFYEVKSPNDRLSALQEFWIRQFQQYRLPVSVLKVSYT